MPRAYTKSGSTEKYESSQWHTPTWSGGATGSVTGPDSNGNYTVNAPSGYVSGGSTVKCTTNYAGITKDFYFKEEAHNVTIVVTLRKKYYDGTYDYCFAQFERLVPNDTAFTNIRVSVRTNGENFDLYPLSCNGASPSHKCSTSGGTVIEFSVSPTSVQYSGNTWTFLKKIQNI